MRAVSSAGTTSAMSASVFSWPPDLPRNATTVTLRACGAGGAGAQRDRRRVPGQVGRPAEDARRHRARGPGGRHGAHSGDSSRDRASDLRTGGGELEGMNAEFGMRNAELNWEVARRATLPLTFRIPHSPF